MKVSLPKGLSVLLWQLITSAASLLRSPDRNSRQFREIIGRCTQIHQIHVETPYWRHAIGCARIINLRDMDTWRGRQNDILLPKDVIVSDVAEFEWRKEVVGTIEWPAAHEGKVLYAKGTIWKPAVTKWLSKAATCIAGLWRYSFKKAIEQQSVKLHSWSA